MIQVSEDAVQRLILVALTKEEALAILGATDRNPPGIAKIRAIATEQAQSVPTLTHKDWEEAAATLEWASQQRGAYTVAPLAKKLRALVEAMFPLPVARADYWGIRYVRTGGWHGRGFALAEAERLVREWQWHRTVPLRAEHDPEYARDTVREGDELHPPIGSDEWNAQYPDRRGARR